MHLSNIYFNSSFAILKHILKSNMLYTSEYRCPGIQKTEFPRTGVTAGFDRQDLSSGNQTLVLFKGKTRFEN